MSLAVTTSRFAAAVCAALCLSGVANAGEHDRIFSYDAESDTAHTLANGGLTFIFRHGRLGGTRVLKVLSTQDHGTAELVPASEKDLGPGGLDAIVGHKVRERDLYEIKPEGQGLPLIRAACPVSDRAWLAFGSLKPNKNLIIHAVGRYTPSGRIHMCATMEFSWHGEWKLPPS